MAIPDAPLTRGEQYLNRIATGEGTIPDEPLTRVEQYLDYIAENGGGGSGVDNVARQSIGTLSNLNTEDKSNLVAAINEVLQTAAEDAQSVLPTDTASGAIASFPDGAEDAAVKSLVAQIAPVQSGSGDPSPDNIRPITGFTGCKVSRTGKNILDFSAVQQYANWSATLAPYGTANTNDSNRGFLLPAVSGETYTISFGIDSASFPIYLYLCRANGTDSTERLMPFSFEAFRSNHYTFTAESGWFYFLRMGTTSSASGFNTQMSKISFAQLEVGSTVTDYEPYSGDTYTIAFPAEAGTVYGGTLDVTNGVLTVTKGLIPSYSGEALPGEWISSMDVYAQGVTPTTGAQVCYDLASPVTYQLTPTEVTTLLGVNNIWADTGDVAVDYRADTGLYIQKLTGSTEEDMIADAPIASGKYFLVGNTLYLSTAAIAAGATLTPGTNCVKTNLAEALNALNS